MMTTLETYRTNEDAFLIVIIKIVEQKKNIVYLLDPWKAGYRDFQEHTGSFNSLKQEIGIPTVKFHKIPKREAAELLLNNYKIAQKVGVEIPKDAQHWFEKLGVFKLEHKGSLYKCFNCKTGDLTQEEVKEILGIAKEEVKKNIVGTKEEEQYFYICDQCRKEMHETHT